MSSLSEALALELDGPLTPEQYVSAAADPELGAVFAALSAAGAEIARAVRYAGLGDVLGAYGAVNVQGEQQQKLDVLANETLIAKLREAGSVAAIVSEEDEEPVLLERAGAQFAVIFDPLDGSSNIDVNVNTGTIFSVVELKGRTVEDAVLRPGSEQVAAGYVLYGPSVVMVLALAGPATERGVAAFTLDERGKFALSARAMGMPEQGPYYSANEANASTWPDAYRAYLAMLLAGELEGKAYSARYIGSLVADFHRTLLKGGVFLYPPTAKTPQGKLRLLYEANPLAMLAEAAGGAAVNGRNRILELQPTEIHQRTALIVGSRREVEALVKTVAAAGGAA